MGNDIPGGWIAGPRGDTVSSVLASKHCLSKLPRLEFLTMPSGVRAYNGGSLGVLVSFAARLRKSL